MASIKIITRRIKSAQNISKITRAMEMVAASKMKKAQEAAILGKPYAEKIFQATRELAKKTDKKLHPLLSLGDRNGKILIVLVSTNKGLCGGLNSNLFRNVLKWRGDCKNIDFITFGKKGQSFVVRSGHNLIADFSEKVSFAQNTGGVTKMVVEGFVSGKYKEVYVVYNSFLSALKQIPIQKMILPLSGLDEGTENENKDKFSDYLMEPSIEDILENLLPHYLENQLRSAIYESEASEQSARMIAMKNATDAALDLMDELTLIYNKVRQEKITFEIADMVTARMAVE